MERKQLLTFFCVNDLPLLVVAEKPTLKLAPPVDIWWIWHVHMLAPKYYAEDCAGLVGELNLSQMSSVM